MRSSCVLLMSPSLTLLIKMRGKKELSVVLVLLVLTSGPLGVKRSPEVMKLKQVQNGKSVGDALLAKIGVACDTVQIKI